MEILHRTSWCVQNNRPIMNSEFMRPCQGCSVKGSKLIKQYTGGFLFFLRSFLNTVSRCVWRFISSIWLSCVFPQFYVSSVSKLFPAVSLDVFACFTRYVNGFLGCFFCFFSIISLSHSLDFVIIAISSLWPCRKSSFLH